MTTKAMKSSTDAKTLFSMYLDAARFYGRAYAQSSNAAALYAKGRAQYSAGRTAQAVKTMRAYLATSGRLAFKAEARATIRAAGGR